MQSCAKTAQFCLLLFNHLKAIIVALFFNILKLFMYVKLVFDMKWCSAPIMFYYHVVQFKSPSESKNCNKQINESWFGHLKVQENASLHFFLNSPQVNCIRL